MSTSASPSLGEVPLNNVAVTASVSGTATGSIVYKLDCTNDGSFEATTGSISSTSYAFSTKCNYSSSGSYTIKVKAERQGISDTGIKSISVSNPPPSSVTIEASPSGTVTNGTSVTYTATANSTVSNTSPTYWIDIFQDGIFKTGCSSGIQCSYITSGNNCLNIFV